MMNFRHVLTAAMIVLPALTGSAAFAQTCQPGIQAALAGPHAPTYSLLAQTLGFHQTNLTNLLGAVNNEATYQALLTLANAIANTTPNGRIVVTLPDGTVVLDTARNDGPGNPRNNTYENFRNKSINENHNSRIAILSAQQFPCGVGVETKTSTSTGQVENYVALRLGANLDSEGTARFSKKQGTCLNGQMD